AKAKPKPRISDKTAPDRSRSKTNTRSQKSRSRPSQSRSRAAERRSRADGDGDKTKKKKALLSSEMLLIAASVLVLALIGGGAYSYFNRVRSVKTLRNDLKIALAEDNVEEAYRIVNDLVGYEGETSEYKTQLDNLRAKVEERKKRRDSNALIDQARKESDPVKALELCQQAADLDPDYAKAHVALGEFHLKVAHFRRREGKIEEYSRLLSRAKSSLEEAMKIDGSNQMAYFLLAEIQTLLNATYPELKANYNRSFMCDKNSWLGMLANARLRELEGREDLAIKNYDNALRKKRNIKEALIARAELYRRKRNYTKALTDIDRVLDSLKNDPDALVLRAHVRLDQNDNDGATDDLKKVEGLDKGNAMALGLRAHIKLINDDRKGSLEDCNAALKIDRNCYYPYRVRGEIRLTAKDADRIGAEGDFRTAVRFAPLISDNHYWYGRLLQENDDKEGALRAYTKCLDLDKKNWRAYCNRGTVRRLLHDYDNALRDVDQAVVLQPKNGQVLLQRSKIRWVRLRKGGIDYKESQWNEVMSDLNEAIRQQPNLSDAYGRRGFIHRRRKKFKESLADYDRAIKLEPEDVYVWYGYRGLLYAEYSEYRKAVEDFGQYLKSAASTHQIYSRVQKERSRVRRELDKNE
ncbi:MAG: tetratricopeptide repeat protein, partial [Planctomycetota bacterium]|nr:tetratricopeptide repeat protein [Planctomycetota bacterium]